MTHTLKVSVLGSALPLNIGSEDIREDYFRESYAIKMAPDLV